MTDELALKYKELKEKEAEEKEKKKERHKKTVTAKRIGLFIPVLFLLIVIGNLTQDQDIDHPTDTALSGRQGKPSWKMLDQNVNHPFDRGNSVKSFQRPRSGPGYLPDYKAEIEKYVIDRCYRKLVTRVRPDLPAPNIRQIEIIKSAMWMDVEKTTRQILPKVQGKPYKERMTVYDSAMGRCRLPYG